MATRKSNHSIDRFLLVTVLGWYYRDCYLFFGSRQEYLAWAKSWSQEEQEYWNEKSIIHTVMVYRAMNVCLREADGDRLHRNPAQGWNSPPGPRRQRWKHSPTKN